MIFTHLVLFGFFQDITGASLISIHGSSGREVGINTGMNRGSN